VDLSPVGIFSPALRRTAEHARAAEAAAELEELGFGSVFLPGRGRTPMEESADLLLSATRRMVIGSGIISVWQRPAAQAATLYTEMRRRHGPRFILGLGVSHESLVAVSGHAYQKPLAVMAQYLDELDAAEPPVPRDGRLIAALGPLMSAMARDRCLGSFPFLISPDGTRQARELFGAGPKLVVSQMVVLEPDARRARELARKELSFYLGLPNYVNNMIRGGFSREDVTPPGSDQLIDGLVALGNAEQIASRVKEQLDAGADHVCLHALPLRGDELPLDTWRSLAAAAIAG